MDNEIVNNNNKINAVKIQNKVLDETDRNTLRDFIEEGISKFQYYLHKDSFTDVSEIIIDLYNEVINKNTPEIKITAEYAGNATQQTILVSAMLYGDIKNVAHFTVLSNYGVGANYLFENAVSVNESMINEYVENIQTTLEIKEALITFIDSLVSILPDHIPYYFYTADDTGLMEERLVFLHEQLGHGVVISICPLIISRKYIRREGFDIHCFSTDSKH